MLYLGGGGYGAGACNGGFLLGNAGDDGPILGFFGILIHEQIPGVQFLGLLGFGFPQIRQGGITQEVFLADIGVLASLDLFIIDFLREILPQEAGQRCRVPEVLRGERCLVDFLREFLCAAVTLIPIMCQCLHHHPGDGFRQIIAHIPDVRIIPVDDFAQIIQFIGFIEQYASGKQFPHAYPEGKDVGPTIQIQSLQLFRGHVPELALHNACLGLGGPLGSLGNTEINEFDRTLNGNKNIGRSDVPVHNTQRTPFPVRHVVGVIKSLTHPCNDMENGTHGNLFVLVPESAGKLFHGKAGNVLHDLVEMLTEIIPDVSEIKNLTDVGMLETRGNLGFVNEHADETFVLADVWKDGLDGHRFLEAFHPETFGQAHFGHSTRADAFKQQVITESCGKNFICNRSPQLKNPSYRVFPDFPGREVLSFRGFRSKRFNLKNHFNAIVKTGLCNKKRGGFPTAGIAMRLKTW